MNKEVLSVIETVCNEKSLDKEDVIGAMEAALAAVVRKDHGHDFDVRVAMDRESGECRTFRRWLVMDDESSEFESPDYQILLTQAQEKKPGVQIGEYIEEPMGAGSFGRIAAHTAKQVIVQKMREAERARVVDIYRDRIGELVMGIVKREEHSGVFIDLGDNAEGFIPRDQLIMRENFRPGDRIRVYLKGVGDDHHGSQLELSRTAPEFLIELFKLEVPEIGQGLIEIKGAARDPGLRAKIAVLSNDPRLDPIGACVGMRGSRVQAVSNELAGERVDIILWNESPAQYVINAMSPAEVVSIIVDEEKRSMDIAVEEDKLSQAIGRGGQNIKLASHLTGWELNVMTEHQADEKSEKEVQELQELFMENLSVDEEVAGILVQEGFSSMEEIVYVPIDELLRIEEFDKTMVEELRERAGDVLLSMAIDDGSKEKQAHKALLDVAGVDEELVRRLETAGIRTLEDLAAQGVEDLVEDVEGMDKEKAAGLIMAARAPWFEAPAEDQSPLQETSGETPEEAPQKAGEDRQPQEAPSEVPEDSPPSQEASDETSGEAPEEAPEKQPPPETSQETPAGQSPKEASEGQSAQ